MIREERGGNKTSISINLFINEVPHDGLKQDEEETENGKPETRHVLLNLDAIIINPRHESHDNDHHHIEKTEQKLTGTPSSLRTLEKIHKLFIFKSAGEPWLQRYSVKTSFNQTIFEGKSDETCWCDDGWTEKNVYLLNSDKTGLLNIKFGPTDYLQGSHERSFTLFIPSSTMTTVDDMDDGDEDEDAEWTRFGLVKLQQVAGLCYITSLAHENNQPKNHLSCRLKPPDSLRIISDNDETVAVIDLQKTKLFQFVTSYMVTFTKDISFHSKAIIVAAVICYDIGFHRRRESLKTVFQYIFCLSFLAASAFILFLLLLYL